MLATDHSYLNGRSTADDQDADLFKNKNDDKQLASDDRSAGRKGADDVYPRVPQVS
jgi:hypothetical protein